MGVEFTKEQQTVIELRDCNILVSAAAGSGKTAVLVERIITRLTKDPEPLNVDEVLIVTYTDAAAGEMKERIHAAIEKTLEEYPDNEHLRKQVSLIHQAKIMTIHKFCLSVLQDHFYAINLEPGFRVAEQGELELMKRDVVELVLEEAFQSGNPEFTDFVESYAFGKNDNKLDEIVLKLFDSSRGYPNPDAWFCESVAKYHVTSVDEMEDNVFIKELKDEIREQIDGTIKQFEYALKVCESDGGPLAYADNLKEDLPYLEAVLSAKTFREMHHATRAIAWRRLNNNRDKTTEKEKENVVKNIRNEGKELIGKLCEKYFYTEYEDIQKDLLAAEANAKVLTHLVKQFEERFASVKREKNIIDFNDMLHFALRILTIEKDGGYIPSPVAENYQQKFKEIMIDEYQDSNLLQETILKSVSTVSKGLYNIFMVGDVKQSIYSFNQSRPELFMAKYDTYSLEGGNQTRVDLHKNFRSRGEVLDSSNFVFKQIMTSKLGGIVYDDKVALHVGNKDYTEHVGNEMELLILDLENIKNKADEKIALEAEVVARKIKELINHHQLFDKNTKTYRNVRYGDIAILCRSVKKCVSAFREVMKKAGIPIYAAQDEGYFETKEIRQILAYLKILDNPLQDIPFAAVLNSVFGKLTERDLAILRSEMQEQTLYACALDYVKEGAEEDVRQKLMRFFEQFEKFRKRVPYTSINELLWQLYDETGFREYISVLAGGEQRVANLEMLIEKAIAFESSSYKGLFHFIRYIEQLEKYDVDYGEANLLDEKMDAVNLMTIHKSKGLEFPIVIVTGIGRGFNDQDLKKSVISHHELGIGIDGVDLKQRTKAPTILKRAIQQRVQKEALAEELRVLYVAMTRAKEKMILVGTVNDLQERFLSYGALQEHKEEEIPYFYLIQARSYMDWVIPALYRNKCMDEVRELFGQEVPYKNPIYGQDIPVRVTRIREEDLVDEAVEDIVQNFVEEHALKELDETAVYDVDTSAKIREAFSYKYPYLEGQPLKQKLSVSELKKQAYQDEEGEELFQEEEVIPLLPKFLQEHEKFTGASRGSAYHKLLELMDFSKDYDEDGLKQFIAEKEECGLLTEEMVNSIWIKDILLFFESDIAKRMRRAALNKKCYAEKPFVLGLDAKEVYPDSDSDELILVQGIIDVYFEEDNELVVVDYKTDRVKETKELINRYHAQLEYYARALEQLTGKRVKEKVIYSFALQAQIEV